jgi:lipopolysaccharide export system ATP-binding protein
MILESHGLVKTYGRRRVVDGVSFEVDSAEVVGLLGGNGAGKSTSFKITCGMIEPDAGQVMLNGIDVTKWPMYRPPRRRARAWPRWKPPSRPRSPVW